MEIKIVTREMLEGGIAIAMYIDEKENLTASIGDLLTPNYERLRLLVAGAVYVSLEKLTRAAEQHVHTDAGQAPIKEPDTE